MTRSRFALALGAGVLALALVVAITAPPGPGLDPDDVSYLLAARTLVQQGTALDLDDEWSDTDSLLPLAHFPPAFPAALAVPQMLGASEGTAARIVLGASAFVSAATIAWLLDAAAGAVAAILGVAALLATPALVFVHTVALSEPLFLAMLVLVVAGMTLAPRRPLATGLAAAAGAMVRYAGLSLVAAAALWQLRPPGRWRDRARRAALAGAPGVLAFGLWAWRAHRSVGGAGVRDLGLYRQIAPTLREGARTVAAWLAPVGDGEVSVPLAILALVVLVVLAIAGVRAVRRTVRDGGGESDGVATAARAQRLLAAIVLTGVTYVGVVIVARLVADPGIPLDDRLLSPAFVLLEVAAAVAIAWWWRGARRAWRETAGATLAAWWIAAAALTWRETTWTMEQGHDYAARRWRDSPTLAWVRAHAASRAIFTNDYAALFLDAGRFSRMIPAHPDSATAREVADTIEARRGIVVLLAPVVDDTIGEVVTPAWLPGKKLVSFPDGVVWDVERRQPRGAERGF